MPNMRSKKVTFCLSVIIALFIFLAPVVPMGNWAYQTHHGAITTDAPLYGSLSTYSFHYGGQLYYFYTNHWVFTYGQLSYPNSDFISPPGGVAPL